MSTGLECAYIEPEPGKWYYVLEQGGAPKNAFDWREYADAYGPFKSEDEAHTHLQDHHANPGGSWSCPHDQFKMNDAWKRLIDQAPANMRAFAPRGYGYRY